MNFYEFMDWLDSLPGWIYWIIAFVGFGVFMVSDLWFGWLGRKAEGKMHKILVWIIMLSVIVGSLAGGGLCVGKLIYWYKSGNIAGVVMLVCMVICGLAGVVLLILESVRGNRDQRLWDEHVKRPGKS